MDRTRRIVALMALTALFLVTATPAAAIFGGGGESAVPAGAPIPQNQDVETYQGVACQGTLTAVDNEGDAYTFAIVDQPNKGAVVIAEDGVTFVYTPEDGKSGKDSFTFTATDGEGNVSAPATVTIHIRKQKTEVTYSDMAGNAAHAAAIRLAEEGLFVGEQYAGSYFFDPEAPVSRSEFLAMAMDAAGMEVPEQVTLTGFQDDESIAAWAKSYASTAVREGIISGVSTEAGVCFNGDDAITLREAAAVMDRILNVADVELDDLVKAEATWSTQAVANMVSVHVVSAGSFGTETESAPVTRAEAAQILTAALQVLEEQEDSGGLLGWLW